MALFADIAARINVTRIAREWFDALRDAGIRLEQVIGAGTGSIAGSSFTVANNQSSAADVTGLIFNGASVRTAFVEYEIYRNTTGGGATELAEAGLLILTYSTVAASWEMTQINVGDAGVTFVKPSNVTGQVQYTSTNITGSSSASRMKFRARTFTA